MKIGKYELNNIYNEDSYKVIKSLPDNSIDLIITDPPYGLNIDSQKKYISKTNNKHNRKFHSKENWDNEIPSKEFFNEMKRVSENMIVFGVNYFNEFLEQGHKGWIVWDKGQRGLTMSDCEIIYSSLDKPTRIITVNRCELKRDITVHPTQKPLKLLIKIIEENSNKDDLIVDFFSGSGTTLEACQILERKFLGFETNKKYYLECLNRLNGINPIGQTSIFTNFEELD
jgi:site-specific DNA-methyltransferase (adenine-specific)